MNKYIAYYRVSTQKQNKTGLGLEAQRTSVRNFLQKDDILVNEYTDIESGKLNTRPKLMKAIDESKNNDAILLIAKLDRLSRNAAFIFTLRDTNVKFKCVDMPEANSVTIGIMAVLAQDERERISQRTKLALAELKRRGKQLGSPQNLNKHARLKGLEVRIENSRKNENNRKATAMIMALKNQDMSFYTITQKLNELGFKTRRNKKFQQNQVQTLFNRFVTDQNENMI